MRHQVIGAAATGRNARGHNLPHALFHQRLHLGVRLLAGVAHALRKVARPDEIDIHAGNLNQLRDVLNGLHFLKHQAHQGVAVGGGHIIRRTAGKPVLGGAAPAEQPPLALGVVLDGGHRGARFGGRVDMRNLNPPGAPVQKRRNDFGAVAHRPHNGRRPGVLGSPDQILGQINGNAAVFVVNQHPVVAEKTQHLHYRGRGKGNH